MTTSMHERLGVVLSAGLGAVLLLGTAGALSRAAELTAVGLWEQVDERSRQPHSWFRISEKNGVYEAAIIKIFFKPGDDPNFVCDKCEGDEKGRLLGIALIKGMHRNGLKYENGTILDPRNGEVFRALMWLSPDGQKLMMRGLLGLVDPSGAGIQIWNRLPDDALQPTPSAPKAATQKK